jgi:hypothetical protein
MHAVRIIESEHMADLVSDFSACRSPSRAARRLKRGIRGRVKQTLVPFTYALSLPNGDIVMHPTMYRKLKEMEAKDGLPPVFFPRNIEPEFYHRAGRETLPPPFYPSPRFVTGQIWKGGTNGFLNSDIT